MMYFQIGSNDHLGWPPLIYRYSVNILLILLQVIAAKTDNGRNFVKVLIKLFGVKLTHIDNVEDSQEKDYYQIFQKSL